MEENYKHPNDKGYFPGAEKIKMPLEFLTENATHSDGKEYKWNTMSEKKEHTPKPGDVCEVLIPVKVLMEWSDKIIADHDYPESDWKEYKEGLIMRVLPDQILVYNGEKTDFLFHTHREK